MLTKRNFIITLAIGTTLVAAVYWLRFHSQLSPTHHGLRSAANGKNSTALVQSPVQNSQTPKSKGVIVQSSPWRQVNMSKAELQSFPNYWMLAYSENDMAWLERHGYPSLQEEEKMSKSSLEQLKALAESGDLNATIHLGLRYSKNALTSGDAAEFLNARRELDRALIQGGPYHSAKTVAFFAAIANDRNSYGHLSASTLKEMERHIIPYHQIARGMVSLYGDSAAERVGNDGSYDLGRAFGLHAQTPMSFEMAMRMFSNINASRMQSGLPAFTLDRRPSAPGVFQFYENNAVYVR